MLKILHARLQLYENQELSDVQAGFRKGRGTRYLVANIFWIIEKAREFQKNIYLCFIEYSKALTVWIGRRNINNLRYMDDIILMAENKELMSLLIRVKEESERASLKLNIKKKKKKN